MDCPFHHTPYVYVEIMTNPGKTLEVCQRCDRQKKSDAIFEPFRAETRCADCKPGWRCSRHRSQYRGWM